MDKKKETIYVLLGAVVLIWGTLVYRFIPSQKPDEKTVRMDAVSQSSNHSKNSIPNFELQSNYRDPFLNAPKPLLKRKKKPKPSKQVVFPKISYLGRVRGPKEVLYQITIGEKHFFFRLMDTHQGVQLLKASDAKVLLTYQSTKKTYSFRE